MFIELQNGAMLNLYWLLDCFQGKHDKNIVIFYMVNGSKIIETYENESDAEERVSEMQESMSTAGGLKTEIVEELPDVGKKGVVYLVPVEDDTDMFAEYVYIDGEWDPWGTKKIDLDNLKEEIEAEVLTKTNTTAYTPTANYHPATKKYVDDNSFSFKAFPNSFNTTGTTAQLISSINSTTSAKEGMAYRGEVTLSDMPFNGNAEILVYLLPHSVIYLELLSTNVSPYKWDYNSASGQGWQAIGKFYADTNFLNKTNTTAYTPTADYHPATKKYVDDAIAASVTEALNSNY